MTKEYYFPNEDVTLQINNSLNEKDMKDIEKLRNIQQKETNRKQIIFGMFKLCFIGTIVNLVLASCIRIIFGINFIAMLFGYVGVGMLCVVVMTPIIYGINSICASFTGGYRLLHKSNICRYLLEHNKEKDFNISSYIKNIKSAIWCLQKLDGYWQSEDAPKGSSIYFRRGFIVTKFYTPDFHIVDLLCYNALNSKEERYFKPGTVIVYSLPEMEGHIITETGLKQISENS